LNGPAQLRAVPSIAEECSRIIQAANRGYNDGNDQPAPPASPPNVQEALTVRSVLLRIKTANVESAGTDSAIRFYHCPAGAELSALRAASREELSGRRFNCRGSVLQSLSGDPFERNNLDQFTLNAGDGLENYETFILDSDGAQRSSAWLIGGLDIRASLSNGTRQLLYSNACLEVQLDRSNSRLILRRSDIAACLITGTAQVRRDEPLKSTTSLELSFTQQLPGAPPRVILDQVVDKPLVQSEVRQESVLSRYNSFGISRVRAGTLQSISGVRFTLSDLSVTPENGEAVPGNLDWRLYLFYPGIPDIPYCLRQRDMSTLNVSPERCGFSREPRDTDYCSSLPENPESGFNFVQLDQAACVPLKKVDYYGDPSRGLSGFHNLEPKDSEFHDRVMGL
jgi:hypothetical protein